MKLAEFDFAKATWDTFRVFHVHVGGSSYSPLFVQFSSGEVIAHGRRWTPYHRTMYRSLNVRILTCGVTCQNALRGTTERIYTQPTP